MNTIRLMNSEYSLKAKVIVLLIVYVIARLYQSTVSWWSSDAFANLKKPDTNIVALIVDKQLYADGQVEKLIERYARDYIQQRISNSKAVIFPIDTKVVQAWDIARMLENLYLDGVEKEPSTLEGVILIGDQVPLPIVNDKGAIFPSLFPYTDFDQPKFYRDPDSQYFIPNGIPNAQAEVRHGVIKLDGSVSDYVHFFKKLQQYVAQPTHYVGDRMWYDDFIDQKQSYNDLARTSYLNNFVFAEDIGYHRYNPLMIDLLNQRENAKNADLVGELASLQGSSGSYASQVGQVFSEFMADSPTELGSDTMQISTVFVDDALQGFQKKYSDLYGVTSRVRMRDNV